MASWCFEASRAQLEQGLAVPLGELVEDLPARGIRQGLEDVTHGPSIGKPLLACQPPRRLRTRWTARSSRSTSACPRTCHGKGEPSSPACSRSRSPAHAGSASSTSTATARATWRGTAVSSARCSSTRSTPIATGSASWAATTSSTGSSARTSPWRGWPTTRSASATATGSAARCFEVTQPRVTCYRVGIRMDDPRIPALLVSHRRPGFYLRVLEEGEVQAGDQIVKLASGPEQMTVAEVDALLYLPGHARQQLQRALRIPALSPGWKGSFRALLDQEPGRGNAGLAATSPPPAWPGFRPSDGRGDHPRERRVISIRLEDPDGAPLPRRRSPVSTSPCASGPTSGSGRCCATTRCPDRPAPGYYRVSVKRERDGAASGYLHTRLGVGDPLDVAAPRGTFILDRDARAGAAGQRRDRGDPGRRHAPRAGAGALRSRDLVAARGAQPRRARVRGRGAGSSRLAPRTCSRVYYSRADPNDVEGRDFDGAGRLTASVLAELEPPRDAEAYVCGPAPFMDEISAGRRDWGSKPRRSTPSRSGLRPARRRASRRRPRGRPIHRPGRPGAGPTITFARSGLAIPWSDDYASLLELAEACDVPVRWSCRTGVCHSCETTLIAGDVDYDPDPVEPPAAGSALICCSRPHDDVVLDL